MKKMDELDVEFIEAYKNAATLFGFGDLPASIIGELYIEPEEITMEHISRDTGYSLASISNTIKALENMGIIQRIKKPGTKKVYFYMEKDLAKVNKQKLTMTYEKMIKPMKNQIPEIIGRYKKKVKDERSKQKLKIVENYYKQILCFEKMILHWIKELEGLSDEMSIR